MKHLPVHWYEGLFLRPQHFQADERYWRELSHTAHQWDHPYHYGLQSLEFSKEALANHQFEVSTLRARLRDGTLVVLEADREPDRLDLRGPVGDVQKAVAPLGDAFETENTIRVYLAVPKLKLGRSNVGNGDARFREIRLSVQDENRGTNDQEIQFRELNARLLLSTQDLSGYELLPIAQIKRASEGEASPQLDASYIPPVLATDAWPGLGRDFVRVIYDIIGEKIQVLSQQVINRGIGRDSREPGDADRIALLEKLNEAYCLLSVLAFAQGVHPYVAYVELCRILGSLAIFTPEHLITDIPRYDHEDLERIFAFVHRRIEGIIHSVRDYEYQQRYFVGVGMGMQVSLEPKWFNTDWHWFIGVHKGDLSEAECRDLLAASQLDWKLGSNRQVEILFKRRAEGLKLRPMDRAIRALPARQDWIYYEVMQDDSPAWRDVYETQTLAMRLKDSLILNLDRLQGGQQLVVSAFGKKVSLQFALFAVPSEV